MIITLLFFIGFSYAQDDYSAEKYCFSGAQEASVIERKFEGFKVPSDSVVRDNDCLMIQMRPHRRELIQRFMLGLSPNTKISFSSEEVRRDPCELKIEKVKVKAAEKAQVGLDGLPVIASANSSDSNSTSTETMHIQTLKEFALTVDQDEIKGQCKYINPTRYEISLEVSKKLKPLVPAELPPGSIVVVNRPPPDQETMYLRTQLQIQKGDRIEIGEIVRNLRDKERSVSINPSLKIETSQQSATEKVFLSLQ